MFNTLAFDMFVVVAVATSVVCAVAFAVDARNARRSLANAQNDINWLTNAYLQETERTDALTAWKDHYSELASDYRDKYVAHGDRLLALQTVLDNERVYSDGLQCILDQARTALKTVFDAPVYIDDIPRYVDELVAAAQEGSLALPVVPFFDENGLCQDPACPSCGQEPDDDDLLYLSSHSDDVAF